VKNAATWLCCMVIEGNRVVLGDSDTVSIFMGEAGEPLVCGGALAMDGETLTRLGKSGRRVTFHRADDGEMDRPTESTAAGRVHSEGGDGEAEEEEEEEDDDDAQSMVSFIEYAESQVASCSSRDLD